MFGTSNDRAERQGRMLAELSELGMSLARRLHEQAMAAEAPEEAERLSLAFHRLSRSVRQTLALEARLERDARRETLEAERRADEVRGQRVRTRKAQVDAAITRLIWTEAERSETGELLVGLDHILAEETVADHFLDGPVETLIARIKTDLGLAANDAGPSPPPLGEGDREAGEGACPDRWNSG